MSNRNIKRLNKEKFLIFENFTIKKTLEVIENGEEKIAFLVNKKNQIISVI